MSFCSVCNFSETNLGLLRSAFSVVGDSRITWGVCAWKINITTISMLAQLVTFRKSSCYSQILTRSMFYQVVISYIPFSAGFFCSANFSSFFFSGAVGITFTAPGGGFWIKNDKYSSQLYFVFRFLSVLERVGRIISLIIQAFVFIQDKNSAMLSTLLYLWEAVVPKALLRWMSKYKHNNNIIDSLQCKLDYWKIELITIYDLWLLVYEWSWRVQAFVVQIIIYDTIKERKDSYVISEEYKSRTDEKEDQSSF